MFVGIQDRFMFVLLALKYPIGYIDGNEPISANIKF